MSDKRGGEGRSQKIPAPAVQDEQLALPGEPVPLTPNLAPLAHSLYKL